MKPSQAQYELLLQSASCAVIADKLDAIATPEPDTWEYVRRHNITAAVIEFWDDASSAKNIRNAKKGLAT